MKSIVQTMRRTILKRRTSNSLIDSAFRLGRKHPELTDGDIMTIVAFHILECYEALLDDYLKLLQNQARPIYVCRCNTCKEKEIE